MLQRLAILVGLYAALAQAYANPGSCSGACNVRDPSLIQRSSDNTYFRFSTGNDISYASASSLSGPWTTVGSMLPNGSSIDLDGNNDLWVSSLRISLNIVVKVWTEVNAFLSYKLGPRCTLYQ